MIIAKYKFNPSTYENYLPEFNSEFTDYTTSDVNNDDGTITSTIESDSLPTFMRFGVITETTNRSSSLLEVLDMNTSNITNMDSMFRRCINLITIICDWNTSQITNMNYVFNGCSSLTSLDVSKWNTSKVTSMGGIFSNCTSLISLDLNNWNTSKVTNMQSMFYNCPS